ncbi:universal stress protein [Nocardia inohanensis]|uniref:universal stress protein n=1 Tax=Nocardia inohanensis TaxID=209246 RepID=UPI00082AC107|nr:universal stress protein [Nocardia inohanensis]
MRRLIVGYLATPSGEDGLALGVRLARTLDAQLDICMVLTPDRLVPGLVPNDGYDDMLTVRARQWLADAVAALPGDVKAEGHISFHESFAAGLIDEVARLDALAIVVGAAGDGLIGRHAIGSVASELLHSAPVPVALAPRGTRNSPVTAVREVTCAIGDRPGADLLFELAVRASAAAGTPLRLVSLIALDAHAPRRRDDTPESVRERALAHAELTLEEAKAALPEGFPVTAMTADGSSVEAAVNRLDWHDGDLIMVGSSRLAQPRRLFLGSTAAKMLRVLQVPMVVVPKEETNERHQ